MNVEGSPGTNAVVHALAEDVLDSVEEPLIGVLGRRGGLECFVGKRHGQLLEQRLLFLRQLFPRCDLDGHEQVAMTTSTNIGHPLAPHAERRTTLCPGRYGERLCAVERRDLDVASERQCREVEWNLAV